MNFKENVINFFSILALLRGPIVWPLRARFGQWATNWRPLVYAVTEDIYTCMRWLKIFIRVCGDWRYLYGYVVSEDIYTGMWWLKLFTLRLNDFRFDLLSQSSTRDFQVDHKSSGTANGSSKGQSWPKRSSLYHFILTMPMALWKGRKRQTTNDVQKFWRILWKWKREDLGEMIEPLIILKMPAR